MRIAPGVLAEIRRHLAAAYPTEGCGLLVGTRGPNGDVVVRRQLPVPNRRAADGGGRTRYLIGPEDFLTAERDARQASLVVVGTYHSHPDVPARPSAYDTEPHRVGRGRRGAGGARVGIARRSPRFCGTRARSEGVLICQ